MCNQHTPVITKFTINVIESGKQQQKVNKQVNESTMNNKTKLNTQRQHHKTTINRQHKTFFHLLQTQRNPCDLHQSFVAMHVHKQSSLINDYNNNVKIEFIQVCKNRLQVECLCVKSIF